jgi:mediator of RNA polymerase II transcription subunit 7
MAEQQPSNALAAAFPSPPPFYQHFTSENLDRIAALRAFKHTEGSDSALVLQSTGSESLTPKAAIRLFDLPPELRFLQPPEPPAQGIFRSFGDVFNVSSDPENGFLILNAFL